MKKPVKPKGGTKKPKPSLPIRKPSQKSMFASTKGAKGMKSC